MKAITSLDTSTIGLPLIPYLQVHLFFYFFYFCFETVVLVAMIPSILYFFETSIISFSSLISKSGAIFTNRYFFSLLFSIWILSNNNTQGLILIAISLNQGYSEN